MAEEKQRYALSDYPDFLKYIDNPDMAKWFIIVLKYGFYNRYHSADDIVTLIEIEFAKLTDIDKEAEYIDMLYGDGELTNKLGDIIMETEVAFIDDETGEEFAESFYLSHFREIVYEQYDEIEQYFQSFEANGFINAMFPEGQGGKRILWMA